MAKKMVRRQIYIAEEHADYLLARAKLKGRTLNGQIMMDSFTYMAKETPESMKRIKETIISIREERASNNERRLQAKAKANKYAG